MKYFTILLISVTLFAAYSTMVFGHPKYGIIGDVEGDTITYRLNISEAQMHLLKDTIFNREKCLITHCPLTLTNNSNDTLKYMAMSASWWDFYTLDNQNFALATDWWNVFKNGQEVLVLPPHQSVTKNIPIITRKGYYRGEKLRIAMRLQQLHFGLPDLQKSLIWSNEVTVN
jgi:hypothetical protein